ncbi:hypothetical protein A2Z00_05260 [Candidatus Gottesmanbacteria bacterium RBG_13_45_10]|uniref:Uncharacterized protein n=1 Tax=Candidatus Gottesmanbacteria bacterium RBG_13_45_10 TaxID=1798370 RepID=A0A1F5ZGV3_9BACT|nr:MAG: hypothetical protein A2Z00_05260 [Candidatus Gottesmanbacteria bacterium RBG_13_45_10]
MEFPHFWKTSTRHEVAWNTLFQVIARAVSAAVTLVVTILIARNFGTNGYGDFVKVTTYIAFFYLLADFGFNAVYLQQNQTYSPISHKNHDEPWGVLLGLRLIVSSLLICAALALLAFIPQGVTQGYTPLVRLGIILFAPSIIFQALITTTNAAFQKHLRYDLSTVAASLGAIVSLVLVWTTTAVKIHEAGVILAVLALLIGSLVTALVGLWFTKNIQKNFSLTFDTKKLTRLFLLSAPLGLTLLFNLVYFHVDSVILTLTRATSEVGIYGLAYKVFELPLVLPTFFMNALYPILLKRGKKDFFRLLIRSFLFLTGMSLVVLGVLWICAPLLVMIKPEFVQSVPALRILLLGLPFFFASSLAMWALIAIKKQSLLAILYGGSMVLNIILDMVFIPRYGYISAAWITVVSEGIVVLISGSLVVYFGKKMVRQK